MYKWDIAKKVKVVEATLIKFKQPDVQIFGKAAGDIFNDKYYRILELRRGR